MGIKIRTVSIVIFVINLLGSIGGAIAAASIYGNYSPGMAVGLFFGIGLGGTFVSYVLYVLMSGFGELVDRVESIDDKLYKRAPYRETPFSTQAKTQTDRQVKVSQDVNSSMPKQDVQHQLVVPKETQKDACLMCKRSDVPLKTVKIKKNGVVSDALICADCYEKKLAAKNNTETGGNQ